MSETQTHTSPATPGQRVTYTGSLADFRGPAVFLGPCDDEQPCTPCDDRFSLWEFYRSPGPAPIRYRLRLPGGDELRCVRAESFTPVVSDTTATAA